MKRFFEKNKRLLKILFFVVVGAVLIYYGFNEFRTINWKLFKSTITHMPRIVVISLFLFGVGAFTMTGFYDVVATRDYEMRATTFDKIKTGWISQAFNNFLGLGGVTGGAIRTKFYQHSGLDVGNALHLTLTIWASNLLGLIILVLLSFPEALRLGMGHEMIIPLVFCLYLPLFFLWDHIPKLRVWLESKGLQPLNWKQKWKLCAVSLIDWLAAALFFVLVMDTYTHHFHWLLGIFVYSFATIVGLISFIPGGFGSFDLTVLLLFENMGYSESKLIVGILVFRIFYYVVPWGLAVLYMLLEKVKVKMDTLSFRLQYNTSFIVTFLSIVLLFAGLMLIGSVLTPDIYSRVAVVRAIFPKFMLRISGMITIYVGMTSMILAWGIRKRVYRAYRAAMLLLPISIITCLVHGFNFEEATFIVIVWGLLYMTRNEFVRDHIAVTWKNISISFLTVVSFIGIIVMAVYRLRTLHGDKIKIPFNMPQFVLLTLTLAGLTLLFLFTQSRRVFFVPPKDEEVNHYEKLIQTYGGNDYSHLVFLKDKQIYFNTDKTAALLYRIQGRAALVLGDPIGDVTQFDHLLDDFIQFSNYNSLIVGFYEVSPHYLDNFCNLGYSTMKIGESAKVDITQPIFQGKKNKNRRMIRNRFEQLGYTFEVLDPPFSSTIMDELKEVSDVWLKGRDELGYSLGFFEVNYLNKAPIAVLKKEDKIDAFATLMPQSNGQLSVDLMRYNTESDDDVMQMLFLDLFLWGQENGYTTFDLGMAPLSNVGNRHYSNSRDKLINLVYTFGNNVYGFEGLRNYKNKFRPTWENRYIIYPNNSVLPQLIFALLEVTHLRKEEE